MLSGVQPMAGRLGRCDNQQMDRIPLRFHGGETCYPLESNHDSPLNKTGQVCHELVWALSPPMHRQPIHTHNVPFPAYLPFLSTVVSLTFKASRSPFLTIPVFLSLSPSLWSFLLNCEDWEERVRGMWEKKSSGSWEGVMAGCLSGSQGWESMAWHRERRAEVKKDMKPLQQQEKESGKPLSFPLFQRLLKE